MEQFLQLAYWFVLLTLIVSILTGLVFGFLFVVRPKKDKRPDLFFGGLLICLALTLVHNLMVHTGVFLRNPQLLFLPVYFTLSFGPLYFYFVKLKLYPQYEIRWSDAKHLILPIGQILFLVSTFFNSAETKSEIGRSFFSPFYGGVEMLLYISSFFGYLYFAYRYIKSKRAEVRSSVDKSQGTKVAWLQRMSKVLFILFGINATYIFTDFLSYELFEINLHLLKGFDYIGSLSFASLLGWLAFNGLVMRKL